MLREKIREVAQSALRSGALQPISTRFEAVSDGGVDFIVRVVEALARKEAVKQHSRPSDNPFLPYDPALYVGDAGPQHVLLLNKFNVLDRHVLIVTRQFEEQESRLTPDDFAALWPCLREMGGLGFCNAGAMAGASQRHKHLQWIPLDPHEIPIRSLIGTARLEGMAGTFAPWTFPHAFAPFLPDVWRTPERAGLQLARLYESLLDTLERRGPGRYAGYNLLLTRSWMLVVPRSREKCEGISVNALGFAGMLLAKNDDELTRLKQIGPMNVLRSVADS